MSITRIRPYGRIYDITGISPDVSLSEIAVYGYLCYMAGSTGSCYPSQRRMESVLHISWDALNNAALHLISVGVITRQKRPGAGRQKWSYIYKIAVPTGTRSRGRITERMITVCQDLSIGAIGLLFTLESISGTVGDIYVNRENLAKRLNVTAKTLRKYINELTSAGEISTYQEVVDGIRITRLIMRSVGKKTEVIKPEQTQGTYSQGNPSYPSPSAHEKILHPKISREEYLSLDGCITPSEIIAKQRTLVQELEAIYHCSYCDQRPAIMYGDVAQQLIGFTRTGSRAEIMSVIKTDMRYLLAYISGFPLNWIADPMIRSAALEVIFGKVKTETDKIVLDQLFWILGTAGDEQNRLLPYLDSILDGRRSAHSWLASLSGRISKALSSRPIQYPAAYARRMILNWLVDRQAQTSDAITVLAENYNSGELAPVPQTFDDLVADPVCDLFRNEIRKLSKREYRERADAYEAIVYEREAAGNPITRCDITLDDEIYNIYAVMPQSYFDALRMIDPHDAEAITLLPESELRHRAIAYRKLLPEQRSSMFYDQDFAWLIEPYALREEEFFGA